MIRIAFYLKNGSTIPIETTAQVLYDVLDSQANFGAFGNQPIKGAAGKTRTIIIRLDQILSLEFDE